MSLDRPLVPLTAAALLSLGLLLVAVTGRDAIANDADSAQGAVVTGVVKFDGKLPKRPPIRMKDRDGAPCECSKLHKTVPLAETAIVNDKGELANVFVYVKKGLAKKSYPLPTGPAMLDQQKCMFRPRVQGIRVGQDFVMRNSDGLVHNVRSFSFRNRAFNIAQPAGTPDRKKVFSKPERAVRVECDIHDWMTAYLFVMDHPYFAVTDDNGQFRIAGMPPGEYTLAAWHEEFGEQNARISVSSTGSTGIEFSFKAKGK